MASKSKTKGKSGEREACKIFENAFGGNWERVYSSGAFVGGKNAFRRGYMEESQLRATKADIHTPDFMPKLVLEVKSYSDFPFHHLVQDKEIPKLEEWLDEIYQCIDPDDYWLLCMKFNRIGWYVLFDPKLCDLEYNNHAKYYSPKLDKEFVFTAPLDVFLEKNKEAILEKSK